MLRWLSAQSLLTRWPAACVSMRMPVSVCVWQNWVMIFLYRNQAHLQTFKSNTLKCQRSILQSRICSTIGFHLPLFCWILIDSIIFHGILNARQRWQLCASTVSAWRDGGCVSPGTMFGESSTLLFIICTLVAVLRKSSGLAFCHQLSSSAQWALSQTAHKVWSVLVTIWFWEIP